MALFRMSSMLARPAMARAAVVPQLRSYGSFGANLLLDEKEIAEVLSNPASGETEEELRRAFLKAAWKKEIGERRETLLNMSEDDRNLYLETEGMPYNLMMVHLYARDYLAKNNLPVSDVAKYCQEWNFSRGVETLDVVQPSPAPEHTVDETPIIKQCTA
mmetsp:Transcript_27575/g.77054  ORF Transcript_27575/g.77054 Transcript_27575/m.77054 type:complete len:160 (-) Transcript_27575:43-522(-)|eukprot:CAMPEP_0119121970 /NCGR_PEP_ID=MMETSP1310-20130426/2372_1 /TAXON_ID=464262 /ORGANISM="Genus nov. species nov., Strain RCC2339" /LENGTH=159 /DNA_ID=CAMNT_0007111573 /DNA_START=67 /DNA_END=546 /DNA_ORIENTATION=+